MSVYGPPDDLYDESADCTAEEMADLLRLVRETRKEWAGLEAIIEADLGLSAGVGQHDGYIVRQASEKVEWDTDALKRKVVSQALEEGDVVDLAEAIWACVPKNPSWRVGGLKALGIDPADYRTRLPGRRTVELLPQGVTPPEEDGPMSERSGT